MIVRGKHPIGIPAFAIIASNDNPVWWCATCDSKKINLSESQNIIQNLTSTA